MNFDVELLGDCDTIIGHICTELGDPWCQVLQGFEIPNVSRKYLAPFFQTSAAFPDECKTEKDLNNDVLECKCLEKEELSEECDDRSLNQKNEKGE